MLSRKRRNIVIFLLLATMGIILAPSDTLAQKARTEAIVYATPT